VPAQGNGSARDLAPDWDVCCGNETVGDLTSGGESGPHWAADSRSLLLLASIRGAVDVFRVFVEDNAGAPRRVTSGTHAVTGFTTAAAVAAPSSAAVASSSQQADVCALLVATPSDAGDIYVLPPGREFFRRLTRLNQALLDEIDLAGPKQSEAPSPSGHTVPFWALLPPDFADKPGPRPAIVYVHGGPHLMYAHTLFWEYQTLAARGYVVLYPNPRGSQGYGEAWTGAIKGNWGEPAHEDVLACVDHAIAQGWADPARLGIAGGSYGGYLSAWVVGHTDRFRAAVAERGVYNLHSMAGTCDFVWIDRNYFRREHLGRSGRLSAQFAAHLRRPDHHAPADRSQRRRPALSNQPGRRTVRRLETAKQGGRARPLRTTGQPRTIPRRPARPAIGQAAPHSRLV
jgi:dienelactone hydrolase